MTITFDQIVTLLGFKWAFLFDDPSSNLCEVSQQFFQQNILNKQNKK